MRLRYSLLQSKMGEGIYIMLTVKPTGAALGAEIVGVDLSQPLDESTFEQIVNVWHEHEVIYFRHQKLTPEQHVRFSQRFGALELHVRKDCCRPGFHELFVVSNIVQDGKPIGSQDAGLFWHSDLCYLDIPSRGSLFYALEVPHDAQGQALGDTRFASATAAFNALSDDVKQKIANRNAIQSYKKGYYRERNAGPRKPLSAAQEALTPDVAHPIVRTHPFTGKKCLFVNDGYTARIEDMEPAMAEPLLAELITHSTKPEFIYQHRWQVGDFLLWDNCSVQHQAVADYQLPLRRHMERTTLTGSKPF